MKILYLFIYLASFLGFSQQTNLQKQLFRIDANSNKLKEQKAREYIDLILLKNKNLTKDTLKLNYGVFVDKLGELFITHNDINDKVASDRFEQIFTTTYFIKPFLDSLKSNTINYNFKEGFNKYIKKHNDYKKDTLKVIKNTCSIDIETVPRYKGCKKSNNTDMKRCMADKVKKHVSKYFNINLASNLKIPAGIIRIFVRFKIDKQGKVTDIEVRSPHQIFSKEATRVIRKIPKMKAPGKQNGKPVIVRYNLPIVFRIKS